MTSGQIFKINFELSGMNFRRLAIWTLVFMTSGLVCLLNPEEGYGIENPKRWRESREILKILKFQKDLKKKYPETFPKGRGKINQNFPRSDSGFLLVLFHLEQQVFQIQQIH